MPATCLSCLLWRDKEERDACYLPVLSAVERQRGERCLLPACPVCCGETKRREMPATCLSCLLWRDKEERDACYLPVLSAVERHFYPNRQSVIVVVVVVVVVVMVVIMAALVIVVVESRRERARVS